MYAQLTYFDGPRTAEQLAAHEFAARERIVPALGRLGHRYHVYLLRREDGGEIVISIAESKEALADAVKAIMSTELLPGEDPALLPGPDRIELYPVAGATEIAPEPVSA